MHRNKPKNVDYKILITVAVNTINPPLPTSTGQSTNPTPSHPPHLEYSKYSNRTTKFTGLASAIAVKVKRRAKKQLQRLDDPTCLQEGQMWARPSQAGSFKGPFNNEGRTLQSMQTPNWDTALVFSCITQNSSIVTLRCPLLPQLLNYKNRWDLTASACWLWWAQRPTPQTAGWEKSLSCTLSAGSAWGGKQEERVRNTSSDCLWACTCTKDSGSSCWQNGVSLPHSSNITVWRRQETAAMA